MKNSRYISFAVVIALTAAIIISAALCVSAVPSARADFTGYTQISTKEQLAAISNDLSGSYVLTADIEFVAADFAEGGAFYNEGLGWKPIGTVEAPFTGRFEGNGHKIKGLYMNRPNWYDSSLGLFGNIRGAFVKNVGLTEVDLFGYATMNQGGKQSIYSHIGAVVGHSEGGVIEGCYSTGKISGLGVGGVVGYNDGSVTSCESSCALVAYRDEYFSPYSYVGGVIGYNNGGYIFRCVGKASISRSASAGNGFVFYAGGVVGYNKSGTVNECHNEGTIVNAPALGGVVGYNHSGTVIKCHNTGKLTASQTTESYFTGGVVGCNTIGSTVEDCYNTGEVSGDVTRTGGVVGSNAYSTVKNSYNTGKVTATGEGTGGVAGEVSTSSSSGKSYVENCYNTGDVVGNIHTGGVIGMNQIGWGGAVRDCHNEGSVTGQLCVGGVAGSYDGGSHGDVFERCYNIGTVTGNEYVGGVVGDVLGANVTLSYNTGDVSGNSRVGGVVGKNEADSGIRGVRNCFNAGKVTVSIGTAGGIVGTNVSKSYTTAVIEYCYNVGTVTGSEYIGGIVGYMDGLSGTVTNCYYLKGCTSISSTSYGYSRNDASLKQESTYSNFDFYNIWTLPHTNGYPYPEIIGVPMIYPHTHMYGEQAEYPEYLATAATCKSVAVYYKSCICGAKGAETFNGSSLDPYNHASSSTHFLAKSDGSHDILYDCCNALKYNEACFGGTASCTQRASCEICGELYGDPPTHDFVSGSVYSKDDNGHAKKCARCDVYDTQVGHTYGTGDTCTACGYEKPHEHAFTRELALDEFSAAAATCQSPMKYYKSCSCGEKGTETFTFGEKDFTNHISETTYIEPTERDTHNILYTCCGTAKEGNVECFGGTATCTQSATCAACYDTYGTQLGHDFVSGDVYSKDENGHALKCARCDVYDTQVGHVFGSTNKCAGCGYERIPEHVHSYTNEVAKAEYLLQSASCSKRATYYMSCSCGAKGDRTFEHGELDKNTHEKTLMTHNDNGDGTHKTTHVCCGAVSVAKAPHSYSGNICVCGNVYSAPKPTEPPASETDAPKPTEPPVSETDAPKPTEPSASETDAPKPTEPSVSETDAPKPTEPSVSETDAPKPTEPSASETDAPKPTEPSNDTGKPEESPSEPSGSAGKEPLDPTVTYLIVIASAVVAAGVVLVIIVIIKKRR